MGVSSTLQYTHSTLVFLQLYSSHRTHRCFCYSAVHRTHGCFFNSTEYTDDMGVSTTLQCTQNTWLFMQLYSTHRTQGCFCDYIKYTQNTWVFLQLFITNRTHGCFALNNSVSATVQYTQSTLCLCAEHQYFCFCNSGT